jgi:predicted ATPase
VPLTAISIQGYRSIQRLHLSVDACSIFVGANGVGKTNSIRHSACCVRRRTAR